MEIHAFSACAARLSDFLLRLSYRQCPIRPYGAPSPRGEGSVSGIAVSPYRSLPHWGRGTASAVDRVLSYNACLRRIFHLFQLSFMPLEPYPARYARHLPHAGKAIKLSGRTFLAPHRGSSPKGLCKRTGFLGVKRRENPVRRHFERSEMRGQHYGISNIVR